jgi:hypothetical protein
MLGLRILYRIKLYRSAALKIIPINEQADTGRLQNNRSFQDKSSSTLNE